MSSKCKSKCNDPHFEDTVKRYLKDRKDELKRERKQLKKTKKKYYANRKLSNRPKSRHNEHE